MTPNHQTRRSLIAGIAAAMQVKRTGGNKAQQYLAKWHAQHSINTGNSGATAVETGYRAGKGMKRISA